MDTYQDYYQLLHVLPDAPAPVIKASYRAMMQKLRHHPDLGGDPSIAQALNLAMETLCDPVRRDLYDRELALSQQASAQPSTQPPPGSAPGGQASSNQSGAPGGTPGGTPGPKQDEAQDEAQNDTSGRKKPTSRLPQRPHCLFCGATRANNATTRLPYAVENRCLRCDAPATPIDELAPSLSDELRRLNRYELAGIVTLWARWPKESALHGSLQDLSLAGCAVECDHPLTGNSLILLEAQLVSAICQVRYCKSDNTGNGFQIGLQFRTLTLRAQPGAVFSTVA